MRIPNLTKGINILLTHIKRLLKQRIKTKLDGVSLFVKSLNNNFSVRFAHYDHAALSLRSGRLTGIIHNIPSLRSGILLRENINRIKFTPLTTQTSLLSFHSGCITQIIFNCSAAATKNLYNSAQYLIL